MTEDPIPNPTDAEKAVLGSILLESGCLWQVKNILSGPESFRHEQHGWIYQATLNLNARGTNIDFVLLCGELENMGKLKDAGGAAYITELINSTPTAVHAEHYAHVVETKYQSRRIIQAAGEIAKIGYDADDSTKAHAQALEALHKIAPRQAGQGLRPMSVVIDDSIPTIQGMIAGDKEALGLSTGFKDLDRAWGGMQRGKLIIVAGRPGVGKTCLVECIAYNAAKAGAKVLFFSAEMASEELVVRMACRKAGVDSSILRSGKLAESDPEGAENLWEAMGEIGQLPLWIDDQPGITTAEIRLRTAQFATRHGLDLVLVDYIQCLGDTGNNSNRVIAVGNMANQLKILGRTFDIPVVAVSQLSRACELRSNFRPRLSDLRESGEIEQEADNVTFLYRHDYYVDLGMAEEDSKQKNICVLNTAKNRSGPTGKTELVFIPAFTWFLDKAQIAEEYEEVPEM